MGPCKYTLGEQNSGHCSGMSQLQFPTEFMNGNLLPEFTESEIQPRAEGLCEALGSY